MNGCNIIRDTFVCKTLGYVYEVLDIEQLAALSYLCKTLGYVYL